VPRALPTTAEGKTTEWKSQAVWAYQRRALAADALIASTPIMKWTPELGPWIAEVKV
jgi:hypothetical protein